MIAAATMMIVSEAGRSMKIENEPREMVSDWRSRLCFAAAPMKTVSTRHGFTRL